MNFTGGAVKSIKKEKLKMKKEVTARWSLAPPCKRPDVGGRRQGGRPQGPFKIKTPSQNVRKIGKPMQGDASVFHTPPGVPDFTLHIQRSGNAKILYFSHFAHVPTVQFISFFTPKNLRFMACWQAALKSQNNMKKTEHKGLPILDALAPVRSRCLRHRGQGIGGSFTQDGARRQCRFPSARLPWANVLNTSGVLNLRLRRRWQRHLYSLSESSFIHVICGFRQNQTDTMSKVIQRAERRARGSSPQPLVNNFGGQNHLSPVISMTGRKATNRSRSNQTDAASVHFGTPVGSCRQASRAERTLPHEGHRIGLPRRSQTERQLKPMKPFAQLTHFAGFDWAKDHHDVVVVDRQGQIVDQFTFPHSAPGWQRWHHCVQAYPELG
jgi:hypothetical protein